MQQSIIIQDLPARQAVLGFDDYAATLAHIIQDSNPRFAVGIFGGWGSGKTTLMNAIHRNLAGPEIVKAEFSAWRYEKEPNLIVPLLDVVREALLNWSREHPAEAASTAPIIQTIGRAVKALLAGFALKVGASDALQMSFDAGKAIDSWDDQGVENDETARSIYHASFTALGKAFAGFAQGHAQRRIVVFVDDLDRCLPQGAMEVLEAMKLFFDLPGFVFVVGLDQKVIEAAVELRYKDFNETRKEDQSKVKGAEYIKKIFQVPFSLSPVFPGELKTLLEAYLAEAGAPQGQRDDVLGPVREHLDYLVAGNPINPRDVKRYINSYTIISSIRPGLNPKVILALQTMSYQTDWSDIYESLLSFRSLFVVALQRFLSGDLEALENLDDRLASIPPEFVDYVRGPAQALTTIADTIEDYIYAGETTKATGDPSFIDAIFDLTKIRGRMSDLPTQLGEADVTTVMSIGNDLKHLGERLRSRSMSDAAAEYAHRELSDVAGRVLAVADQLKARTAGTTTAALTPHPGPLDYDWAPLIARIKALIPRLIRR